MRKRAAVLFVDDDADLCAVMKDMCRLLGAAECETLTSLAEVEGLGPNIQKFHLTILDINLGSDQPNGVEVFHWLVDQGYRGRVVFLTGHAHDDPRALAAAAVSRTVVLSKPISTEALRQLIENVEVAI